MVRRWILLGLCLCVLLGSVPACSDTQPKKPAAPIPKEDENAPVPQAPGGKQAGKAG